MAKSRTTARRAQSAGESFLSKFDLNKIIPVKYQAPVFWGVIILTFLVFYAPLYFGGMTFKSGDIITSGSMVTYVQQDKEGYTLWNPYIFGGMPAYAIALAFKWFNLIYVGMTGVRSLFEAAFTTQYSVWTLYLIILSFTTFYLVKHKTGNNLASLFAALTVSFSTGIVVFLYIGHVTKLTALCFFPLIFLMLLKFQQKIKLLDFMILVIGLQLMVQGWHVQIIFYILFAVMIYFIYFFARFAIKKDKDSMIRLVKSGGTFAAAAIIALLIQADNFTQIYEYTPYSTRGEKSIVENQAPIKTKTQSEFYDYATNWSFSPGEVMTFIIPSYYGFGYSNYNGPLTNNQDYRLNTYFGQMPFVDVAMYMGVVVFLLALFAAITSWKDPFVQFLSILSLIALFISFGRTFPVLYDLMFYHFPFFDKFRVPSMMLVLIQVSLPILAAMGIHKIVTLREETDVRAVNIVKYAAYAFSVLFVLSLVLTTPLKDMFSSRMLESAKNEQHAEYLRQVSDYASDMFVKDAYFAMFFAAATFWLAFGYIRNMLSKDLLIIPIIILAMTDLFRIDNRGKEYIPNANIKEMFVQPGYINAIKAQKDKDPYRIFNLKQDGSLGSPGQHSNYHAHFLVQDIYGYSGIKPRAYQDILDVIGDPPVNPTLWRMLNVKYIVMDKQVQFPGLVEVAAMPGSIVYKFENALPRAYFVNSVQTRPMIQMLNAIKNNEFDPKEVAFIEEGNIKADRPDSTAKVEIVSYKDEHIVINAKASGNNFLFLGDTYFPMGWKALVDGNETLIYRTNHGFRGIVVPKGVHKVEFVYAPASFFISQKIVLVLSSITIIGLFAGLFIEYRRKK